MLSLSLGSLPPADRSVLHAAYFSLATVAAWWLLCGLSTRMVIGLVSNGEVSQPTAAESFFRQTQGLRWLALALVGLMVGGFGFGRTQGGISEIGMAAQAVALLSPAILLLLGLWAAECYFAVSMGWEEPGIRSSMRSIWEVARLSIGWLVAPVILLLAALDVVAAMNVAALLRNDSWWTVASVSVLGLAAFAGLLVVGIPFLVRQMFVTEKIEASTEQWMRDVLFSVGLPRCKLLRWQTHSTTFNAMVAGIIGPFRVMVLSDRLIDELPKQQLAMVMLHEVAHAKRRHVALRLAIVVPAWSLGILAQMTLQQSEWGSAIGLDAWSTAIGSGLSLLATLVALRLASYWIEFDADRVACRLAATSAQDCNDVPNNDASAARELAEALRKVSPSDMPLSKRSWMHPSIQERVERLTGSTG